MARLATGRREHGASEGKVSYAEKNETAFGGGVMPAKSTSTNQTKLEPFFQMGEEKGGRIVLRGCENRRKALHPGKNAKWTPRLSRIRLVPLYWDRKETKKTGPPQEGKG